jgi:Family of unknown function (DUF6065)
VVEQPERDGVTESDTDAGDLPLVAFPTTRTFDVVVEPAPRRRAWMDATDGWAYRCLPLVVANESGWVLKNRYAFRASWSGGDATGAIVIEFDDDVPSPHPVQSHFGWGVITWAVPYLFRTPPGYNLLARGPANWPRDGICPLEGLVETDWSVTTFTMNWQFTRPGADVRFEQGDPFCMIVPQRRGELERFVPDVRSMSSDPEVAEEARRWSRERDAIIANQFLAQYSKEFGGEPGPLSPRSYFRGKSPDGRPAPEHETRINLRSFPGTDDAA